MVVDEDTNRLAGKEKNLINPAILISAALFLGLYLIFTTVLIAKDGVTYIEEAQMFSNNPIGAVRGVSFGYSFLVFLAHKAAVLFCGGTSVHCWILSAQCVTLLCRLSAIIPLYFIGKILVGGERSFWAVLILIMLPYPAELGSNALRDWPHIMFLAWGMLFLIIGSKTGRWRMFAVAGFAAGLGHTIRPECAQIVIYGVLWLLIGLFLPRPGISRLKTLCLILAILIGFAIPAAPYFKAKGEILPPKLKKLISCNALRPPNESEQAGFSCNAGVCTASAASASADVINALAGLVREISDNMMHFFMVPLVIGFCEQCRRMRKVLLTEWFFIYALLTLYLVMMVLLKINYGYIGRRHCMPMVVFAAFYVPAGLQILARWLCRKTSKNGSAAEENIRRWFFILIAVGFGICAAKLARITPLRWDKQGYKDAAEWLSKNTAPTDIIAVTDKRIAFYAERKGLLYDEKIPKRADYVVRIVRSEDEKPEPGKETGEEYSTWVDKRKKGETVVIYRAMR